MSFSDEGNQSGFAPGRLVGGRPEFVQCLAEWFGRGKTLHRSSRAECETPRPDAGVERETHR
ncbi:MAG: hypothetical protein L0Z07_08230, partial [Planctomycetes bacterium]|nr:hypothetical protein [Planctomycetota bacterium]